MKQRYEKDLLFSHAVQFDKSYRGVAAGLKTAEFVSLATTFQRNADLIVGLGSLPIQLIMVMWDISDIRTRALCQAGVAAGDTNRIFDPEFQKIEREIMLQQQGILAANWKPIMDNKWRAADQRLASFLWQESNGTTIHGISPGIIALLAAMITAAYAAFEILAGDLWITAANKEPSIAANFFEKNKDKQLPGNVAASYGFDMSKSMGTILRDTQRVTFDSLNNIRRAYNDGFRQEFSDVFEKHNIVRVEKVRHLIAHRAGVVDQKFKSEMVGDALYGELNVGNQVTFSGPTVCEHIDECVKTGVNLLSAVDDWIGRC